MYHCTHIALVIDLIGRAASTRTGGAVRHRRLGGGEAVSQSVSRCMAGRQAGRQADKHAG